MKLCGTCYFDRQINIYIYINMHIRRHAHLTLIDRRYIQTAIQICLSHLSMHISPFRASAGAAGGTCVKWMRFEPPHFSEARQLRPCFWGIRPQQLGTFLLDRNGRPIFLLQVD